VERFAALTRSNPSFIPEIEDGSLVFHPTRLSGAMARPLPLASTPPWIRLREQLGFYASLLPDDACRSQGRAAQNLRVI